MKCGSTMMMLPRAGLDEFMSNKIYNIEKAHLKSEFYMPTCKYPNQGDCQFGMKMLKNIHANCFCASLQCTQNTMLCMNIALSNKMNNDRADGHTCI